jgi:hypothetical protein
VNEGNTVSHVQELFLSNERNKDKLINLLMVHLSQAGHTVHQSTNNADTHITKAVTTHAQGSRRVRVAADDARSTCLSLSAMHD